MFDLKDLAYFIWGQKYTIPNMVQGQDLLPDEGLTMGTLILGRQGSGKTSALARHLVDYFKRYSDRAIFILDWSGSITDTILNLILQEPEWERLSKRIVYDEMGHPEWCVPLPEFSREYGFNYEEQVQRVTQNLARRHPDLMTGNPTVGGEAINHVAPNFFRLLTAVQNEHGENWQITETKKLILEPGLLKRVCNDYGGRVPEAKYYLENAYLESNQHDQAMRSMSVLSLLSEIEPRPIRARVGYYRPGWTPKEAIEKGLLVLINGARLINQENAQHYLFTQVYSLIMQVINARTPADPKDKPVSLVLDEVYSLIAMEGMADEIGRLSPQYRSRKLELYVVAQMLSQFYKDLREKIWSIGNVLCFGMENIDDAEVVAKQLFSYNPKANKLPARNPNQNPVSEPEHGQDRQIGDWIQKFGFRECILKRYVSEQQRDKYLYHIPQTISHPTTPPAIPLWELKERLTQERGVRVRDALEEINKRQLPVKRPPTAN